MRITNEPGRNSREVRGVTQPDSQHHADVGPRNRFVPGGNADGNRGATRRLERRAKNMSQVTHSEKETNRLRGKGDPNLRVDLQELLAAEIGATFARSDGAVGSA